MSALRLPAVCVRPRHLAMYARGSLLRESAQTKHMVQQKKKERNTRQKPHLWKSECVQQGKGRTFKAYDGSRSHLKADNPRHIVIGQDVHCHSVSARQDSTSAFSVHQTNKDALVIFWLRVIQDHQSGCLCGFTYKKLVELEVKSVKYQPERPKLTFNFRR